MVEYPEPKVVVSQCLGFKKCRYNGQTIPDDFVEKLGDFVNYTTVCPEEEIGLGTPRDPLRIGKKDDEIRMVQPATGKDVTKKMQKFTASFLEGLDQIDGFLMKNRSPSCGINDVKVYHHLDQPTGSDRGEGFFGGQLAEYFPGTAIEDEGRLKNYKIREHFLIKLFTNARFRKINQKQQMKDLVKFHSNHKYLFLAYNEEAMRACGSIVANHEQHSAAQVFSNYREKMHEILAKPPKYTAIINTLHHIFGGVSDNLSQDEKQFFLNSVEEYRDERIPLSTLNHMLKSYAIRFDNDYLKNQVFLEPYPRDLVEITDSGKGRNH
ncbi:MAG: DUF523 and DUF1722 domain-containing protein [Candidatus Marinimicrobia bacterium]|nr:DUF523 and DUF1722 domain-containing protein [Candidatus Neomarinimicrobiota bacterium]